MVDSADERGGALALFDPKRHEKLTDERWNEADARTAIERIVTDTRAAFAGEGLWPIHPLDRSPERADVLKPLYYGAAGVIWALHRLGAAETGHRAVVPTLLERSHADERHTSYLLGDVGYLLLEWTLTPSDALANRIHTAIESHPPTPVGVVWGTPGTLLAALFLHERTGDDRWRELFVRKSDTLWQTWTPTENGGHLWTQDLYGQSDRQLGGLHGFAACVLPLLRGRELLPAERQSELLARVHHTVQTTALREDGAVNWPFAAGPSARPIASERVVQHCNGAPGFINCLSALPAHPEVDALFRAAGEIIWQAGPPAKLPSLCHGTPGNGYALLELYARTGDDAWLDRARRFAMHAIDQAERGVREHGQRKFSLWTGDLGLALYLADCISGNAAFPTLDVF